LFILIIAMFFYRLFKEGFMSTYICIIYSVGYVFSVFYKLLYEYCTHFLGKMVIEIFYELEIDFFLIL